MSSEPMTLWELDLKERVPPRSVADTFSRMKRLYSAATLNQHLLDYFRCPEGFIDFSVDERISSEARYFLFGPNTTCYGRSVCKTAKAEVGSLPHDLLAEVLIGEDKITLPFDPTEVIDNLRLERYRKNGSGSPFLKSLYYWFRPFTNAGIRRRVQQFHARNWQHVKFPHWPVDTTVESLCETLMVLSLNAKHIDRVPFIWFWPKAARGCVAMTHDVEAEIGLEFCSELMDIDDSFGIKASFQLVPEARYITSPEIIQQIRDRGFEIDVQDLNHDGRLFDNEQEFMRRIAVVNEYGKKFEAKGFRAGVLYRRPDWFEHLDFSFDMSVPNVAHLDPQRGGCCTVMPYFVGRILEIPVTTTQDYTLLRILNQRSIQLWKAQLDIILRKNGLASFIIHPDYVIDHEARSVYEQLLRHLSELRSGNNIWFALPRDIDTWWRRRTHMRLEQHSGSWQIVGDGAEDATLAYARNVNGKLIYELAGSTGSA
jgi:hypothetical protein